MNKYLRQYRQIDDGEEFVIGADCSVGGHDYSCAQFISRKKLDVPLVYHSPVMASQMTNDLAMILPRIEDITGIPPMIAYERNNGGAFEMERLAELNRKGKWRIFTMPNRGTIDNPDSRRLGWDTNTATRGPMLSDLKGAIEGHIIKIYDKPTIEEMFSFIIVQTSSSWKAQAEKNAYDDRIMALAIAYQLHLICDYVSQSDSSFQFQFQHARSGY